MEPGNMSEANENDGQQCSTELSVSQDSTSTGSENGKPTGVTANNGEPEASKPPEDNTDGTSTASIQSQEQIEQTGSLDMISGNKFFVLLTGNTLKAHEKFIDHLKAQRPNLRQEETVDQCDFILLFCPVVSRAGTDIEAAVTKLQNESGSKPAVLVVLHHTFDPYCVVPDSSRAAKRKNSITVDCLFHEDHGLLQCPKNNESLERITKIIPRPVSSSWLGNALDLLPWPFSRRGSSEAKIQSEDTKEKGQDPKTNENGSLSSLDSSELRMVLMGRTGSGKTEAGNTILSSKERNQAAASTATFPSTQQSESTQREVAGRKVTVVDTPDWFSPGLSLEKLRQDVGLCVRLSVPGPHTFLLVIPVKQPTGEARGMLEKMEQILGEGCWETAFILFTVSDEDQKKNIEMFIHSGDQEVQKLVEKCGNRFHCLNVKESGDGSQVSELIEKIKKMVEGSSEKFYSSEIYLETLAQIGEIEKKLIENPEKPNDPANVLIKNMKKQKYEKKDESIEIQEVYEEEMKTTQHEIWRSIFTSTMKMQEKFRRQLKEKDIQINEMHRQLKEKEGQKNIEKEQSEFN